MTSRASRPRRTPQLSLVATSAGDARVVVEHPAAAPRAVAVLGHGAGGDTTAPVVVGVTAALVAAGVAVARVDQPYRVAGRRVPPRSDVLDAAMRDVVAWLRADVPLARAPLVLGGKSSGARVACRVARECGAVGAVALGFPLSPPGRPHLSRSDEALHAGVPVLVCQGSRDAFGTAEQVTAALVSPAVTVHEVRGGDHSFVARRADGRTTADCLAEVAAVVVEWVLGQADAT